MPTLLIIYIIGIPLSIVPLTIIAEIGKRELNAGFKVPIYKVGYAKFLLASILWPLTLMVCIGLFITAIINNTKEKKENK